MTDTWGLMTDFLIQADRAAARPGRFGRREGGAGFTLVEVMVAVVIIGIVMTAVFRLQGQTISMAESSRFYTTATLLAQRKMAEIRGADMLDAGAGAGNFGDDHPGYSWRVSVDRVNSETLGETGRDLMRVDVTIRFAEDGREFHLRAYRLAMD